MLGNNIILKNDAAFTPAINTYQSTTQLTITYPKNNQKVRGNYKIYGMAKPGAIVKLQITSSYFKTATDSRQKISKGDGPIKRMNRQYTLTANRTGYWMIENIELRNSRWEENFTITATSEGTTVTTNVFDHTHPMNID